VLTLFVKVKIFLFVKSGKSRIFINSEISTGSLVASTDKKGNPLFFALPDTDTNGAAIVGKSDPKNHSAGYGKILQISSPMILFQNRWVLR